MSNPPQARLLVDIERAASIAEAASILTCFTLNEPHDHVGFQVGLQEFKKRAARLQADHSRQLALAHRVMRQTRKLIVGSGDE